MITNLQQVIEHKTMVAGWNYFMTIKCYSILRAIIMQFQLLTKFIMQAVTSENFIKSRQVDMQQGFATLVTTIMKNTMDLNLMTPHFMSY